MIKRILLSGLMLAGLPCLLKAEEVGDRTRGLEYARKNCASCHSVSPHEGQSIVSDAPDFVSVANTPGMTPTAIAVWLQTPHPNMPNFIIPERDIDDLAAYITSLKKPK
jgi:mono/diheme cytochrome c family protein